MGHSKSALIRGSIQRGKIVVGVGPHNLNEIGFDAFLFTNSMIRDYLARAQIPKMLFYPNLKVIGIFVARSFFKGFYQYKYISVSAILVM